MACPHVAGAAALLFQALGPSTTVAQLTKTLLDRATPGKVSDPRTGSPNLLLYVGDDAAGPTPAPPPTPAPTPRPTPVPQPAAPTDCNFEQDMCFWKQDRDDQFDWTRHAGSTGSGGTGPSKAAEGKKYLYIETSSPRVRGQKAKLSSPPLVLSMPMQLEFKYHMYGSSMGKLSVLVDGVSVWSQTGNQGNVWKSGKIDLPTKGTPTITFVGERGSSYRGDAAIDAIKFVPVGGGSTTTTTNPGGGGPSPTPPAPTPPAPTPPSPTPPSPTPPGPAGPPGQAITVVGPPGQ